MGVDNVRLLVMERVDGDTLENFLVDRKVSGEDKVVVVLQLLDAVRIMRANKVTHNDLHLRNVMVRDAKKQQRPEYEVLGVRLPTDKQVKVFDWDKSIVDGLVGDAGDFNPSYDLVSVVVRLRDAPLVDPLLRRTREVLKRAFEPLFSRYDMRFENFAGKEHLVCRRRPESEGETLKPGPDVLDDENERFIEETPEWCVDNRGWPPTVHGLIPRIRNVQIKIIEEVLRQKVPLIDKLEALYV
jgi:serine/threonine protein kinase